MRNTIVLVAALMTVAACAYPGRDVRPVKMGNEATSPRTSVKAQDGGRAAGAGGSHAPGSTGLGAGTMGVEQNSRVGSTR